MAGDVPTTAARLDDLIQLMRDIVVSLNGLRADFRAHDHGAAYAQGNLRINGAPDTITGAEQNALVTSGSTPAQYEAMWDQFLTILGATADFINRSKRF